MENIDKWLKEHNKKSKVKLTKWDVVENMDDEEFILEYIEASFENRDTDEINRAIQDVARSRNIKGLATKMGLTYQEFYKILYGDEECDFSTIQKLLNILEIKIDIEQKKQIEQNRVSV